MNPLAEEIASLDDMRCRLKDLQPNSEEAERLAEEAEGAIEKIGTALLTVMSMTTSGITRAQQRKNRQDMWARLIMALGGGLALVVPNAYYSLASDQDDGLGYHALLCSWDRRCARRLHAGLTAQGCCGLHSRLCSCFGGLCWYRRWDLSWMVLDGRLGWNRLSDAISST